MEGNSELFQEGQTQDTNMISSKASDGTVKAESLSQRMGETNNQNVQ